MVKTSKLIDFLIDSVATIALDSKNSDQKFDQNMIWIRLKPITIPYSIQSPKLK